MKTMIKRVFSVFMVFTFLLGMIPTNVKASTWNWFFDSDIKFYTDDTAEAATSVGRLYFAVNEDGTTVSAVGSYIIDKDGNIDDTKCDSIVVIPDKVTYNNVTYFVTRTEGTFFNKNVESVTFPDSLIEIGKYTLRGTNVREVNITKNIAKIDPFGIIKNQYLTVLSVNKENTTFFSSSNVVYTKDEKSLVLTANLGKKISVKDGVQSILGNAFSNCVYSKGSNDFVSILNELTLPASITYLEDYSISSDVLVVVFKGKLPIIKCDIIGMRSSRSIMGKDGFLKDGPLLVVPASYVSSYKKIAYNGTKIEAEKVTSTLNTKQAKANKAENDIMIKKIDWKKATGKLNEFSDTQWKEFKAYYDNISKKYITEEEKVKAVLTSFLSTYYINGKLYENLENYTFAFDHPKLATAYGMFKNPQEGSTDNYIVKGSIAALRTIDSVEALKVSVIIGQNVKADNIIFAKINDKFVIIDIAKEAGRFKEDVRISNLQSLQTLKYYDVNRNLFNYYSNIFTMQYYSKDEVR